MRPGPAAARLTCALLTTAPLAVVLGRSFGIVLREPRAVPESLRGALLAGQAAALALAVVALAVELAAALRGRLRAGALAAPGRLFVLGVAGWMVAALSQREAYEAWRVDVALTSVLAAHALLLLLEPALARRLSPRLGRGLWIAGLDVAGVLVLAEIGLRVAARTTGLQLLQSALHVAADVVAEAHLEPHARHGAGTLNARGFTDEEFGPRVEGRARVVAIGDSFSTGVVTYTHHYTTVAERELGEVEILNVGVPRVGPYEYLHLYRHECVGLDPDLIVVAFFVGNDVFDAQLRREGHSLVSSLFDRRYCLVIEVPRRLLRLRGQSLPPLRAGVGAFEPLTMELAEQRQPWIRDPFLENATVDEATFRRGEAGRVEYLERVPARAYAEALAPILELRELARPVPVVLLLLADEFQVEEHVWRDALADLGLESADRDRAQRELARVCAATGLPLVDTLPALRAVEPLSDGRRHVYHLRDTHFNARGNRVVGLELARYLREHLQAR